MFMIFIWKETKHLTCKVPQFNKPYVQGVSLWFGIHFNEGKAPSTYIRKNLIIHSIRIKLILLKKPIQTLEMIFHFGSEKYLGSKNLYSFHFTNTNGTLYFISCNFLEPNIRKKLVFGNIPILWNQLCIFWNS
jgi:hypothetical protein